MIAPLNVEDPNLMYIVKLPQNFDVPSQVRDLKFQTKIKLVSSMGLLIVDTHEGTERSKGGAEIMLTSI